MKTKSHLKRNAIIAYYLKSLWPASAVLLLLLLAIFMHAAFCSGCREIQSCCGRLFWEIRISDWLQMGFLVATLAAMFAARHVAEMKIASDMLEKYGVKEMKNNVSALAKVNVPAELKNHTRTPENNKYEPKPEKEGVKLRWTELQDTARREIKMYYLQIWKLYKGGYINKEVLDMLVGHNAFSLLFKVVEPMEKCWNKDYNEQPFYELMELCGEHYKAKEEEFDESRIIKEEKNDG